MSKFGHIAQTLPPPQMRVLSVYRYLIQPYPHDSRVDPELNLEWSGLLAVAIAHSREEAFAVLQQRAMEEGDPWQWLLVADVEVFPLIPSRIVWAQL